MQKDLKKIEAFISDVFRHEQDLTVRHISRPPKVHQWMAHTHGIRCRWMACIDASNFADWRLAVLPEVCLDQLIHAIAPSLIASLQEGCKSWQHVAAIFQWHQLFLNGTVFEGRKAICFPGGERTDWGIWWSSNRLEWSDGNRARLKLWKAWNRYYSMVYMPCWRAKSVMVTRSWFVHIMWFTTDWNRW